MASHSSVIIKSLFLTGIFTLIASGTQAYEPEQATVSMRVLKEWAPNAELEKDFEASRRQWLASLRTKRKVIDFNEDEIHMEELDAPNEDEDDQVSKELLNEFVEIIKKENENPS